MVIGYTACNQSTLTGRQLQAGNVESFFMEDARMAEGTIKKLVEKGFGFIKTGGTKDLYFHSSSLQGVGFDQLQEGQKVSYTEGKSPKGPCAENVTLV
jgi:CspA family cold shock protein